MKVESLQKAQKPSPHNAISSVIPLMAANTSLTKIKNTGISLLVSRYVN